MALGLNEGRIRGRKEGAGNAHHDPAVLDAELLERGLVVDGHLRLQPHSQEQAGRQGRNRGRKSARRFLVGREGMGRGS
jgi:hypothetical protein